MTTSTALAAGVHPDDIPALLDRIAALRDEIAERDRLIRALRHQVADQRAMLADTNPRPPAEWCEWAGWEGLL